jgi:hypothetical protein
LVLFAMADLVFLRRAYQTADLRRCTEDDIMAVPWQERFLFGGIVQLT